VPRRSFFNDSGSGIIGTTAELLAVVVVIALPCYEITS